MATVRFSKELIERIITQAVIKMTPAFEKAQEQKPDNTWGQRIYDTLFLDVKPVLAQLPAGWVKTVKSIRIYEVSGLYCDLDFTFATPQPWPETFPESELAHSRSSYAPVIGLTDHLVWSEFHAEAATYMRRVAEATERRNEFVEAVKKICNAYSTLAPALKAWPPLWELVPEDVKDKHREIVGRTKTEVVLDVDIGKLTAMSTAAKFGI